MKVLVTGAGGFVCRSVVNVLLAAGHEVIALDRAFDSDLQREWAGRVTLIESDAGQLPDMPVDALVHGAAITASPADRHETPEANFRANLEPLLAALEWSQSHGVKRFLTVSSGAVYSQTAFGAVTEDQPPTPDGLYAVAKSTMEGLVNTLFRHYERDALVIRLGSVYGPGEQSRATRPRVSGVQQMLNQALDTGTITLSRPDEAREWTYAPDIGQAVLALLSAAGSLPHALYNVASGQVLTDGEIAREIQTLLPDTAIEINEDATEPALTRRGWLANDRLRQDIGFENWTPFASGLAAIIAQQREQA